MEELNQLLKVAREAAFFIRSIDGYENNKIANELSSLAEKVESQKLLTIGRLAARVVYRNAKKSVEQNARRVCFYCEENKESAKESICQSCADLLKDVKQA